MSRTLNKKTSSNSLLDWILGISFILIIPGVPIINMITQKETPEVKKEVMGTTVSSVPGDSLSAAPEPGFVEKITDEISLEKKQSLQRIVPDVILTPEKLNSLSPEEKSIVYQGTAYGTLQGDISFVRQHQRNYHSGH